MIVKGKRVARLTPWSAYPRTFEAITRNVPDVLWRELTSRQLAMVIDVMQLQFQRGGGHALREACNEGIVYSPGEGRSRVIGEFYESNVR